MGYYTNNSPTSFNGAYFEGTVSIWSQYVMWFRFHDDGSNRTLWWSPDGIHWVQVSSVGNTSFVSPNMAGFGINAMTAGQTTAAKFVDWSLTTP